MNAPGTPPARILVVAPAWVGDMVMADSLFQLLHRQYPEAVLDVLAPRWTLPLLRFMPEVSGGIALRLGHGEQRTGRAIGRPCR